MNNVQGWEWFITRFKGLSQIDLTAYKRPQMERRINSFMKSVNALDYKTFIDLLIADKNVYTHFMEHITINVSDFFRNPDQWTVLARDIIPALYHERASLRVWSAGCSTGEEPYSLAMLFKERFNGKLETILATDLDQDALAKAKMGLYTEKAVQNLPKPYLAKYFSQEGDYYRIDDSIKRMVHFQQHNLLKDVFPRNCDLILCRNVVIYFTEETKQKLYLHFANSLNSKGIIFIGSTEQIFHSRELNLQSVATFFYRKA